MKHFLQRFTPFVHSHETWISITLGIILGIFLGLPHWIGLVTFLGWMVIPAALVQLFSDPGAITHISGGKGVVNPDWVSWANWGIVFFYILFLCCYVWWAYQATRQTGAVSDGIRATLWAAFMMILSAIIPAALTLFLSQTSPFSLAYLGGAITLCLLFAIPLSIIALLTGLVGSWIGKRRITTAKMSGGPA